MIIIDILLLGFSAVAAYSMSSTVIPYGKPELPKPKPKLEEPENEVVMLVLELLKENEGWTVEQDFTSIHSVKRYLHTSGVEISRYSGGRAGTAVLLYVKDDDGVPGLITTSDSDDKRLSNETKQFDSRAKAARQDELARVLASRIVSGTTVPALLGDSSGAGATEITNMDHQWTTDNSISANQISYSTTEDRIIRDCSDDTGTAFLSRELEKRYKLKRATMPERQIR